MKVMPRPQVQCLVRTPVPQADRYKTLRLDKNECCTGYPAQVVRSMLKGISGHHLAAYPEPGLLYEKVAKWHGIEINQLALTSGSELAIRYLFEAFLNPGNEVVVLNPSFAMFEVYARLCGAKLATADFDRQWRVEPDEILRLITPRTKIVALANPNNPTGTVLNEKVLVAIVQQADRCGALVLIDEAYYHFYKRTMLGYLPRFDNLVVTRTFSKACGVAGVRLGYAVGHPRVIAALNKVQPIDHVSVFAVRIGMFLIDHEDMIEDYVRRTEAGKRYLLKALAALGFSVIGSHANFLLVDFGQDKDQIVQWLRDRRIHVGTILRLPFPSTFVRVTAAPVSVMKRFVTELEDVLREHRMLPARPPHPVR